MRVHFTSLLLAPVLLFLTLPLMAQQPAPAPGPFDSQPPQWKAQCEQFIKTPLPEEANTPHIRESAVDVHSFELYYGLGDRARNYVAARHQAWGERAPDPGGQYGGLAASVILAMIYANGLGTPRNSALAMRMACESAAFSSISIEDLEQFAKVVQSQPQPPPLYDFCDPLTGTPSTAQYICPTLTSARAQQEWSDRLKAISAGWTPEQKQKLDTLKYASRFYLAQISLDASILKKLEDAQLQQIETMDAGHLPATTPMPTAEADAHYNAIHSRLLDQLRAPSKELDGTDAVQFERIVDVDWIAFRDAWLGLVASRFPNLDADKWRVQLTEERTEALRKRSASLPPVDPDAKDWMATCAMFRDTPLPEDIRVARPTNRNFCSSAASYYGLGAPVDYAEARRCAIQERFLTENEYSPAWWSLPDTYLQDAARLGLSEQDLNRLDEVGIKGSSMLAMIYADGKGVPRNTALAMRFTCEAIDDLPNDGGFYNGDDKETYRTLLQDVATSSKSSIDMCNIKGDLDQDLTTCDYIDHLHGDWERKAAIKSFGAKYTPGQKAAYLKLVSSFEAYIEAHNNEETSNTDHDHTNFQWLLQPREEKDFIDAMGRFESGKLPSSSPADYAGADRALNALYRQTMATAKETDSGGAPYYPPAPKGLLDTERLWLAYRDAWAAFGAVQYPQVSKESWLTWATLQRIDDLKTFGYGYNDFQYAAP